MKQLPVKQQMNILRDCISNSGDLYSKLQEMGLSYDSLRYRHNNKIKHSSEQYRTTSDFDYPPNGIPSISFFTGAGGLDLGFEAAGFEHLAAFETNPVFCDTLRMNRPSWNVFEEDLSKRDNIYELLKKLIGNRRNFDGVFHGGPPCQPFSIAANQRFCRNGSHFKHVGYEHKTQGTLLFDFVWYVLEFRPLIFLIENVPGLVSIDMGEQLKVVYEKLYRSNYSLSSPTIVNAVHFGVPQERKRVFIIGYRGSTVPIIPLDKEKIIPCYKVFNKSFKGLSGHDTRKHSAKTIMRYLELDYGMRDKLGRVDRLDPNLPSKTVIAGGSRGGGRSHLHPSVPRTLSAREGARLQTFPDNYAFSGPPARQINQVGNAVPPLMAMKIARHLYNQLFSRLPKSKKKQRLHRIPITA